MEIKKNQSGRQEAPKVKPLYCLQRAKYLGLLQVFKMGHITNWLD
jgi:hypothetical protein